jgi:hypothetical protein
MDPAVPFRRQRLLHVEPTPSVGEIERVCPHGIGGRNPCGPD